MFLVELMIDISALVFLLLFLYEMITMKIFSSIPDYIPVITYKILLVWIAVVTLIGIVKISKYLLRKVIH